MSRSETMVLSLLLTVKNTISAICTHAVADSRKTSLVVARGEVFSPKVVSKHPSRNAATMGCGRKEVESTR